PSRSFENPSFTSSISAHRSRVRVKPINLCRESAWRRGRTYVPSSVERRSSTSARGFMLSRLSDAAAEAGDQPISLAMAEAGSNGPLWPTLLHCSEKDAVDTSDAVRLRLPAASTRLRVDGDEQHPPRSPAGP